MVFLHSLKFLLLHLPALLLKYNFLLENLIYLFYLRILHFLSSLFLHILLKLHLHLVLIFYPFLLSSTFHLYILLLLLFHHLILPTLIHLKLYLLVYNMLGYFEQCLSTLFLFLLLEVLLCPLLLFLKHLHYLFSHYLLY